MNSDKTVSHRGECGLPSHAKRRWNLSETAQAARGPPCKEVIWIATALVLPNPFNPRKDFDESDLTRFGLQLKSEGIKQPVRVYQSGENYSLIGGERRWRACLAVGIETIPVIVEDKPANEQELILDQLSENGSRPLSPLERAEAFQRVMRLNGWSATELGQRLRVSTSEISRSLSVKSNLAPSLRPHVQSGRLAASIAYELCKLRSQQRQVELAEQVLNHGMTRAELVFAIQVERQQKGSKVTAKPVKLAREFDPAKGYESIRNELSALLMDVQRCEKNNLPLAYLNELWGKKS